MPFDFKKEYRALYLPKTEPEIVTVPPIPYLAVRGQGDPNEPGGAYQQAVGVLYSVAYTLKMSDRNGRAIDGFFPYVVPPLEGFWWQPGADGFDYGDKSALHWISVLRLPDFVTEADLEWAKETAAKKKKLDCAAASLLTIDEGLCVQLLHVGAYDSEPASVEKMDRFLAENGCVNDFTDSRRHHEIYLSDPNRTPPEKRKTVLRHPIRRA